MKKLYLFIAVFLIAVGANAQTTTYMFDFAFNNPTTGYNNCNMYDTPAFTLVDNAGGTSSITMTITTAMYNGENSNGTTAPTGDAAIFASTATQDNVFGFTNWSTNGTVDKGEFTLTGLNVNNTYSFDFFGSRTNVSDNRVTLYSVTGSTTSSTTLNTSNNTSNIASVSSITPDAGGKITISFSADVTNDNASKFYYLGAIRMVETSSTSAVKNDTYTNKIYFANNSIVAENMAGTVKVYSVSGAKMAERQLANGKLDVNLSRGLYIISIGNVNQKIKVK